MRRVQNGFTLVEVLVVIAILLVFASVVYLSADEARQASRDAARDSDLDQIELVLREYVEQYGPDIDCDHGMMIDGQTTFDESIHTVGGGGGPDLCNDGQEIIDFLNESFGRVPHDPRGPGDGLHYYYLDVPNSGCFNKTLLFARNYETEESNILEICDDDGDGVPNVGGDGGLGVAASPSIRDLKFVNP